MEQVKELVRDVRADLAALPREEVRAADPAGELGILVGALDRVVVRLEDRLAQLGQAPPSGAAAGGRPAAPRAAPSAGSAPAGPPAGEGAALSEVSGHQP